VETDIAPRCEFLGHEVFCGVHKLLRLKAEHKFFIKNDRYGTVVSGAKERCLLMTFVTLRTI